MDGILLVDKPSGWTSFDVVAKVRGIIKQPNVESQKVESETALDVKTLGRLTSSPKVKVGHTGTLDPLATGLLVLVVGSYCKRAGEFSKLDKTYEVTMKLGQTSTTGDEEGVKTQVSSKDPGYGPIKNAIASFIGITEQVPPVYSAIKVNGQRVYKLARAGKEVKLEPRKVTIYGVEMTDYSYPEVKFTAKVSSGTYIRSLVEDIGKKLGTGAYMSDLRRTKVGHFDLKDALRVTSLSTEMIANHEIIKTA